MIDKSNLQLIRGGLSDTPMSSSKEFINAYITDSRLMGVVGIYAHWFLPENVTMRHFHQFFYFDAEEHGFDSYESVLTSDAQDMSEEICDIESRMMNNLGAKKVSISEREVKYMLQQFVALNIKSHLPLPEKSQEYEFLLFPQENLSQEEEYALMCRQCPVLKSEYEVINYFIMRCVSRDFGAAKFLTKNYVRTDLFPEHKAATLLQNTIDEATDIDSGTNTDYYCTDNDKNFGTFNTRKSFMCQSLIEYSGKYFILVTQVSLDKLKVAGYERISSFRISTAEVSMMTSDSEYITVFNYMGSGLDFDKKGTALATDSMETRHETGRLFMIFYPHNEHVNKQHYKLTDDVIGTYYVMDNGQIIASARSSKNIRRLEADLLKSDYASLLIPMSKYHFREQVLFDFIHSDIEDFEAYVDIISETDPD